MDVKKDKLALRYICKSLQDDIDYLKDGLDHANSELSRLDFEDEVAAVPHDRLAGDAKNQQRGSHSRFGKVTLPIHYTLGRDVAEVLGDDVESAVFRIFREVANEISMGMGQTEIEMLRSGFLASVYWDKENQIACLHVELVHTDSQISGEDFDAYDREYPPGRPLN
ncbi:MAG: hypothetical protein HOB79_03220 [Rhodospirillaceae bacterium]|nr:hypothetical protein [Rhodospirillaceae bacterium]